MKGETAGRAECNVSEEEEEEEDDDGEDVAVLSSMDSYQLCLKYQQVYNSWKVINIQNMYIL